MTDKLVKILKELNPQASKEDFNEILKIDNLIHKGYIDSISLIEFVSSIEQEFGIEFEPNDMEIDNFKSISKIEETIRRKKGIKN